MNEKGNRYAISTLKAKRATIAGEIALLKRQLQHKKSNLVHVDATLKLLDPSIKIAHIPNKRPPKHVNLFRMGELSRLVMGAFRKSDGRPMTSKEITRIVLDDSGFGEDAWTAIGQRVRANLAYLKKRGKVEKFGVRKTARWRLNHSSPSASEV